MGADSLAKNTQNAPEFICPICLPKPKSLEFWWKKASLGIRSPCLNASFENEEAQICIVLYFMIWPDKIRTEYSFV
jgi:hypothetical protein